MDIVYTADFFFPESQGGAELNDAVLLNELAAYTQKLGVIKTAQISPENIEKYSNALFIISNFIALSEVSKAALKKKKYIIYEHDHKYLSTRNPGLYSDYKAPSSDIINRDFYENAFKVICQSGKHEEILKKNLGESISTFVVGGNLWSNETLDFLTELAISKEPKVDRVGVMVSSIAHKNTWKTEGFCLKQGYEVNLIYPMEHRLFLSAIAKNKYFAFLPLTPETLSRVVVEARMVGCKIIVNDKIGARYEPWFDLKGVELIQRMREVKFNTVAQFAQWAGVIKLLGEEK